MNILVYILISTILVSFISLIGAIIFYLREQILNKILLFLVALSAGALIGGAFLHLIPEAVYRAGLEEAAIFKTFLYLILGFCTLFILEQFISWHHHHATEHPEIRPFSYLILISDSIHNFIDGLIIAGSFAVALPTGLITTLAVVLHEIPHEIGDFAVLIYCGFKKARALFFNFLSAITAIFGGIAGFFLSEMIGNSIVFLLPFAAGNFIYIAASDLIPEIKEKTNIKKSLLYFFIFLIGIIIMAIAKLLFKE